MSVYIEHEGKRHRLPPGVAADRSKLAEFCKKEGLPAPKAGKPLSKADQKAANERLAKRRKGEPVASKPGGSDK